MKTNFSVEQISNIATKVRTYKKLFVTTRGQMFRTKETADAAVRTLNAIIDDSNEFVGVLPITDEMLSVEKLRLYGKNPTLFDALFSKAKIPVTKDAKKEHERKGEEAPKDTKASKKEVADALGLGEKKVDEKKVDKKKVDEKKVDEKK